MDYEKLARDYMKVMYQMRRRNAQKQLNDSMHGEHFVLSYISKHEGGVIPSEISNEMGISTARVAAALNNLEGKGLITRAIDEADRRRILVNLTGAGRAQVERHDQKIMMITTKMLQYLGENDAKEFLRIMKRLADKMPEDFMQDPVEKRPQTDSHK